jgi:hypothetical protein
MEEKEKEQLLERAEREGGWTLSVDFEQKEEFEKFLKEFKDRFIVGLYYKLVDSGVVPGCYGMVFVGAQGSRLILRDLEKEIREKYPSAETTLEERKPKKIKSPSPFFYLFSSPFLWVGKKR